MNQIDYRAAVILIATLLLLFSIQNFAQCPSASLSFNSNNSLCAGDQLQLTASFILPVGCTLAPGTPYVWSGPSAPGPTSGSQININIASEGSYTVAVQVVNDVTDPTLPTCPCNNDPLVPVSSPASNTVTVNPTPSPPISLTETICPGAEATFTAQSGGAGTNGYFYWYDGPAITDNLVFTGNPFVTGATFSNQTYYVSELLGDCESGRSVANVVVLPLTPPGVSPSNSSICSGSSITLTASTGGANGTFNWYADQSGADLLFVGSQFNTGALASSTSYWVSETAGDCETGLVQVNVSVSPIVNPTVTSPSTCVGASAIVEATSGGANGVFHWYNDASGANLLYIGNPYITPPLFANSSFWVKEVSGNCESGLVQANINTVATGISNPSVTSPSICVGSSASVLASSGGANGQFYWYDNAAGTNLIFIGNPYTTPILTSNESYWVREVAGDCVSALVQANVTTNVVIPEPIIADVEICENESAQLQATTGGGNGDFYWYNSDAVGTLLGVGHIFNTPPLTNSASYWVLERVGDCQSEREEIVVTVHQNPANPATVGDDICPNSTAQLTANGSGTINWYDAQIGGMLIFVGANYTTPTLFQSTIFYAQVLNPVTTCVSERIPVVANVSPAVISPSSPANVQICFGENATLSATGTGTPNNEIRWYAQPVGGVPFQVNTMLPATVSFSTPQLFTTTNVYVAEYDQTTDCESERTAIRIEVNSIPPQPSITDPEVCENSSITINAPGTGVYKWYDAMNGGNLLYTGLSYSTPALTSTTSFYVSELADGCESPRETVTVSVDANPASSTVSNNGPLCEHDALQLSASNISGVNYNWTGPNGFTSSLQNPLINDVLESDHQGFYSLFVTDASTGCNSDSTVTYVEISTVPQTITLQSNGILCEGDVLVLATNEVSGAGYNWTAPDGSALSTSVPELIIANATISDAGSYSVDLSVGGCTSPTASATVQINTKPDAPQASNNSPVCENEILNLNASSIPGAIYLWTGPNGFSSNQQNIQIDGAGITDAGNYSVIVSANGCLSDSNSTTVVVNSLPSLPSNISSNSPVCEGLDLELNSAPVSDVIYRWTGPNGFSSAEQNPVLEGVKEADHQGFYSLTITDTTSGCSSIPDEILVDIFAAPVAGAGNDVTIIQGESAQLFATGGSDYNWSPGDWLDDAGIPNPLATPPAGVHSYEVNVSDGKCSSIDSVTITVESRFDLVVYEVFSPNGDGANDTWVIDFIENISNYEIVVFDRGGEDVFNSSEYVNDWDGTYQGKELPEGPYWYVIRTEDKEYKGGVSIIR